MKGIDIAQIGYGVTVMNGIGEKFILDGALLSLRWEEQEGQLAQKATMRLAADTKVGGKWLRSILKLNCVVRIFGKWGAGKRKVFEGAIWEWQFTRGTGKELTVTAYDPMIRLQQSKDFKYFSAGLTTPALLRGICSDWGIELQYKWREQITHKKEAFNGEAISDMIIKVLEEVRRQTGERYVARHKEGKLQVIGYGANKDIYVFTGENAISVSDKLSMGSLVTRVKVIGKADDEGRTRVEAVMDGKLKFGVLQEVIQRDGDKDLGMAKAEAKAMLDERGKPSW